jgi:hypothetical protein
MRLLSATAGYPSKPTFPSVELQGSALWRGRPEAGPIVRTHRLVGMFFRAAAVSTTCLLSPTAKTLAVLLNERLRFIRTNLPIWRHLSQM